MEEINYVFVEFWWMTYIYFMSNNKSNIFMSGVNIISSEKSL